MKHKGWKKIAAIWLCVSLVMPQATVARAETEPVSEGGAVCVSENDISSEAVGTDVASAGDETWADEPQAEASVTEIDTAAEDTATEDGKTEDGKTEGEAGEGDASAGGGNESTVSGNDPAVQPALAKARLVGAYQQAKDIVMVTYEGAEQISGIEFYRAESADLHDRRPIGAVPSAQMDGFFYDTDSLQIGSTYYYQARVYKSGDYGSLTYGDYSDPVSVQMKLAVPVITQIKSVSYTTVKVQYAKVEGADGYEIYRSKKAGSGYKKMATIKNAEQTSWQDKKCSTGIKYYYKIRAYKNTSAGKCYSELSAKKTGVATLPTPKLKKAQMAGGDTAQLTWKKVAGAQGYQVYRSESLTGKYKKVQTVKGNVNSAQIGGQENGKYYYYKIKAYRRVSAKNRYSSLSGAKGIFFNLYGNANETYTDKAQRIFGKPYYEKYASEAEAKAHMTTFVVRVWDFGKDKTTKVTKSVAITTHVNIAETVKKIFQEIYESDEKFPIKTLGCYSWRGDSSTSEHCCGLAIDINWEENYMIDNGVILSGKYWRPGEDPYSIPLDCELVNIMNKYGFSRGFWGERKDYMHFSYFGT